MDWILNFLAEFVLPFTLGGVVIGSIVRAIDNRTIRDLKTLLQGFGVLRVERPRWAWFKRWGISLNR